MLRGKAQGISVSDRLLDAAEVAELLAVPVSWVRRETRAGRMPCLALGRYRRYSGDAVAAWLEGQRVGQWRKYQPRVRA
jgi:excisionase family DNA binding protein